MKLQYVSGYILKLSIACILTLPSFVVAEEDFAVKETSRDEAVYSDVKTGQTDVGECSVWRHVENGTCGLLESRCIDDSKAVVSATKNGGCFCVCLLRDNTE